VVKARRRMTEETSTGTIKGKLQYMAPEQALAQVVDRRADIFAIGATLYRLLARRPVYRGTSPLSTYKNLTSSVSPEPLPPHVPGALSTIVLKALAFEPERRFATAAELQLALEALLQGPYQTTAREVAACVEQYLGPALAARRAAINEALEEQTVPVEKTQPTAPEWESGISQAKTLPRNSSVPPSGPPTRVDRALPPPPNFFEPLRHIESQRRVDLARPTEPPKRGELPRPTEPPKRGESTRSTNPPRRTEPPRLESHIEEITRAIQPPPTPSIAPDASASGRAKLVAVGGVLALGGALAWVLTSHAPSSGQVATAPLRPLQVMSAAAPSVEAPVSVQALPTLDDTPLSPMPALAPNSDVAAETHKNSAKHKSPASRLAAPPRPVVTPHPATPTPTPPRPVTPPPPKKKVVDDGF
jgi:serine/threonine-protein kinase